MDEARLGVALSFLLLGEDEDSEDLGDPGADTTGVSILGDERPS